LRIPSDDDLAQAAADGIRKQGVELLLPSDPEAKAAKD